MEPVVAQNPDGTWTVVSTEGTLTRTTRFTADWVFTGATEVDRPNATTVVTMEYNSSYLMTGATSVITENGMITTRTFDGNWALLTEMPVPDTGSALPVITISDAATVTEGGQLSYTVSLDKAATSNVTVQVSTAGSTATSGSDFTAPPPTVTIPAGQTGVNFVVNTINDTTQESAETVVLQLSNPSSATLGAKTSATGTINDNYTPPADLPTISIADAPSVVEGAQAHFSVTLSKAAATDVVVQYTTVDDTAIAGSDYTARTGSFTIRAGQTTFDFVVQSTDDTVGGERNPETFSVSLTGVTGATLLKDGAVGRITDNDAAPVLPTLTIADAAPTNEGGVMTFTVTLSAAQTTPVSVQYFSSIRTPDYTSNAGTLTFNPGESTKTITIQTNTDAVDDPNETVTMTLQQPTGATIADAIAVGTIVDVPAPTGPTLSINDVTVNEGGNALFTITLSQAPAAGQTVTVDYATQNGTAVNGADYLGKTGKVTFFAGQTTASVVVEVHDDIDQEGVENLKLNLSNAVGATIIKSSGAVTIDASDATGNPPPGSLAFTAVATGQIRDSLANGAGPDSVDNLTHVLTTFQRTSTNEETRGALEFDLSSVTGNVSKAVLRVSTEFVWDAPETLKAYIYTGNGQVTVSDWSAGTEAGTASFATSGSQNRAWMDITLDAATVQAAKAAGGIAGIVFRADGLEGAAEGGTSFYRDGATLFIEQGTTPPPMPTVTISDGQATEGGVITFTATLSAAPTGPVSMNYATSLATGTNAAAANDFTAATGTLTWGVGDPLTKTFTVQTTQDGTVETNETFNVALSSPTGATLGAKASGVGTILNDDSAPLPTLTVTNASAVEGQSVTFTVTRTGDTTSATTVGYNTSLATGATAAAQTDFTAATGTLSFAAGETSKTVTVQTTQDTAYEPNEVFNFNLTNPTGATITTATATGTITNDDAQPTAPTLSVGDVTVTEGGVANVVVTLSAAASGPVTVNYATAPGTAVAADFTAASGTLTFAAGETTKTVAVTTINDTLVESTEAFNFNLTAPTGATIADAQGVITITDNDTATTPMTINGTAAANTLNGTAANEIINGLGGNDAINGGAGDDQLNGGAGADWLRGGLGNDTLTGGAGTDRFIFDTAPAANNVDTITDIDLATEALFLENAVFNVGRTAASATNPLVLQANFFRAGAAQDADDRVLYDQATGTVSYDADGNGAGVAVAFARVTTGTILSQDDFYVI